MATVYLAHDLKHQRNVALKVLHPDLAATIGVERFLSEIKVTANLQHPNILGLFDSGIADGQAYYVMPYVDGESLRDRLTRERQLPIADALRIAHGVAAALEYAHAHGVIHRDIKPENILLQSGQPVVADFGIALAVQQAGGQRLTQTGMSLGTPQYMSPEQAMGERSLDARTDIYALGVITYEMLAGEPPFSGPNAQAIVAQVLTGKPRPLSQLRETVSPQVEAAVHQALQKLPADRFATAAEFSAALGSLTSTLPTPDSRFPTRPSLVYRLSSLLLVSALAIVAVLGWLRRPPSSEPNWLSISLSDSLTLSLTGIPVAFSPDGRTLVFRDDIQNGHLWIKQQGQLEPVPIPGTERGQSPAFSPDGQWIAFSAAGALKKVRLSGGAVITLVDSMAPPGYGMAWLDDGTIIYPNLIGDQLRRIPADGGQSRIVLADSGLRGLGLINLTPLPGARGVLFTACQSGCVTSSLHVLDLRSGKDKALVPDAVAGWYLPIGQLFYVRRDGAAFVAPFDLKRLQMSGAAVPALDRVKLTSGNPTLAWSGNGSLLYVRSDGRADEVEYARVTLAGVATTIDSSWFGAYNSGALSPDGRRVAVGAGLAASGLSIWIKQLDHGPFSRLSFGGQDRRPAWSPDGKSVAFIRDSSNGSRVYSRPIDGSDTERLLSRTNRLIQEVTWSDDGMWLVFRTDNGDAGAGDLIAIRTTGDATPISLVATPFTELHPAVSHDSHWLAYTSNESGANEVYVRPFPETSTGRWQVSNGGGSQPVWSPDGKTLYFLDRGYRLMAATLRIAPAFEVLTSKALFSAATFSIDRFHTSFTITPDGKAFLFAKGHAVGRVSTAQRAVLVENWFADLKARMKQ